MNSSLRYHILRRDSFTCMYCGGRPPLVRLQVDHYIAVSRGGTDHPSNLITSCAECNRGKSTDYVEDPCSGCPRPTCKGPLWARDQIELVCRCKCHRCEECGSAVCDACKPGGGSCKASEHYRRIQDDKDDVVGVGE